MTKIKDVYEYIESDCNEKRLFYRENGKGMRQFEERPDQAKWERPDCKKCFMPFSVVRVGKFMRCEKCGAIHSLAFTLED